MKNNTFYGEVVAFTGKLSTMTRNEAIKAVRERGGQAYTDMYAATTLLVIGEKPGRNKLGKASRWSGVRRITEEEFMRMLSAGEEARQPIEAIKEAAEQPTAVTVEEIAVNADRAEDPAELFDDATAAYAAAQTEAAAIEEAAQLIEAVEAAEEVAQIERPAALVLAVPQGHRTSDDDAHDAEELQSICPERPAAMEELASGNGWRFVLDATLDRTRLIFDREPSAEAAQAIEAARFFWSPTTHSYHKRLTRKAQRAALALADELHRLAA